MSDFNLAAAVTRAASGLFAVCEASFACILPCWSSACEGAAPPAVSSGMRAIVAARAWDSLISLPCESLSWDSLSCESLNWASLLCAKGNKLSGGVSCWCGRVVKGSLNVLDGPVAAAEAAPADETGGVAGAPAVISARTAYGSRNSAASARAGAFGSDGQVASSFVFVEGLRRLESDSSCDSLTFGPDPISVSFGSRNPFFSVVMSTSFTGLKYWATVCFVFSLVELISHKTRKSAIIAVIKSAKAIFQAPP